MHFAVLAAGQGSRLSSGVAGVPKPLATVGGDAIVKHLLDAFAGRDCTSASIVTNAEQPQVAEFIRSIAGNYPFPVRVAERCTDSPLQTLCELLDLVPAGRVTVTTVDTYFATEAMRGFCDAFNADVMALLGVTSTIDDESPLYIETDANMRVRTVGTEHSSLVSAGVYGLSEAARKLASECYARGCRRLREFQTLLVESQAPVIAYDMGEVYDIDRPQDLSAARAFHDRTTKPCRYMGCYNDRSSNKKQKS